MVYHRFVANKADDGDHQMLNNEPTILRFIDRRSGATDHRIHGWNQAIALMQSWTNGDYGVSINEPCDIRRFADEMDETERIEGDIDAALALADKAGKGDYINDFGRGWAIMSAEETARALADIAQDADKIEFLSDDGRRMGKWQARAPRKPIEMPKPQPDPMFAIGKGGIQLSDVLIAEMRDAATAEIGGGGQAAYVKSTYPNGWLQAVRIGASRYGFAVFQNPAVFRESDHAAIADVWWTEASSYDEALDAYMATEAGKSLFDMDGYDIP